MLVVLSWKFPNHMRSLDILFWKLGVKHTIIIFSFKFSLLLFHLACFLLAFMVTRVSYDEFKTWSPLSSKSPLSVQWLLNSGSLRYWWRHFKKTIMQLCRYGKSCPRYQTRSQPVSCNTFCIHLAVGTNFSGNLDCVSKARS